jgi:hypothetical protein
VLPSGGGSAAPDRALVTNAVIASLVVWSSPADFISANKSVRNAIHAPGVSSPAATSAATGGPATAASGTKDSKMLNVVPPSVTMSTDATSRMLSATRSPSASARSAHWTFFRGENANCDGSFSTAHANGSAKACFGLNRSVPLIPPASGRGSTIRPNRCSGGTGSGRMVDQSTWCPRLTAAA